jgi:methoxymalonate biosynthesis acyl carrier protein
MSADECVAVISRFLQRHTRREHLDPEENIFAAGYVNSLFALQLVMFVEKKFQIAVADEDLDIANFCSVSAIERFVRRKVSPDLREQV